jgi:hypothetical protein
MISANDCTSPAWLEQHARRCDAAGDPLHASGFRQAAARERQRRAGMEPAVAVPVALYLASALRARRAPAGCPRGVADLVLLRCLPWLPERDRAEVVSRLRRVPSRRLSRDLRAVIERLSARV